MSATYSFKKIDNYKGLRYRCDYTQNEFYFGESLYFTTIVTSYNGSSYSNANISNNADTAVTSLDIADMLNTEGIKVDLSVAGKETANLILPLVSIDDDYVYFRDNDGLILKVDSNGAVTEVSTDPVD